MASDASNPRSSGRGPPDGGGRRGGSGGCRLRRRSLCGCGFGGGRRILGGVFVVRLRVGVGREQHRGVALGVEHLGGVVRVLRQLERVGGQAGDGRRGLHADLDEPLDTETACGLLDEEQILGLDPAHRAGELPCQQLDDDLAAQLARPLVPPGVVVGEDLVERLGGHQVPDLLDEVAVQGERPRHQVRDVAADEQRGIRVAGMTRSSARRKSATPTRSTDEWNGTSMPGTRMNDRLPPLISRRRSTSSSSSSRPRTVPAIAYCEPRRLKFTICRNSPVRSAISSTKAGTSSSSRSICDGRIAASR